MQASLPTQQRLKQLFSYNPETGLFTRLVSASFGTYAGDIAGHLDKEGYVQICVDYKLCRAHRLAWLYMTGNWPTKQIDHINRIKNDNRFSNLRDVSNKENSLNKAPKECALIPPGSKSKYVGVSQKRNSWRARVTIDGKQVHLGVFKTEELANAARQNALTILASPSTLPSSAEHLPHETRWRCRGNR